MNERELFLKWHYSKYLEENPEIDMNSAKYIYDYAHKNPISNGIRESQFIVWQASVNREGFVLVPRYCTNKMAHAGKCIDGRLSAFKYGDVWDAMIEASQENKDE